MPMIIGIIVVWGVIEKKSIFDLFLDGAKEGLEVTIKIFPTLIGIFFAIGLLRSSGILNFINYILNPITDFLRIPSEIMPLALIRPISGSAATGVATDIMKQNGVDSYIGKISSVIMGATETTIYIIALYMGCIKVKKSRGILAVSLVADFVSIIIAVFVCGIFF